MKKEATETQPCRLDSGFDSCPRHFPVTHFPVLVALERSFPVGVVFSALAAVRRRLSGVGLEGWSEPRSIDVKRFVPTDCGLDKSTDTSKIRVRL
jgi:hypothetical protein